jgi:hypothetical protein
VARTLAPLGVQVSAMFGMLDGKAFGGLFGNPIVFKLKDDAHAALKGKGAVPFDLSGMGRAMKEWDDLAAAAMTAGEDDEEELIMEVDELWRLLRAVEWRCDDHPSAPGEELPLDSRAGHVTGTAHRTRGAKRLRKVDDLGGPRPDGEA